MFVLIISRGIASDQDPQWGSFEKDQAEAIRALGHKVVVISLDCRFRLRWRKIGISHLVINKVNYYNLFIIPQVFIKLFGSNKLNFIIQRKLYDLLYKKVIDIHGKPDVIYSHYLSNSYIATCLKKKYTIPLIAIEHWSKMIKSDLSSNAIFMAVNTYPKVDALISVSQSLRQNILTIFGIDSIVVPNMIGSEFNQQKLVRSKSSQVCFISIGSLLPIKGFDLLISAFNKANLPSADWILKIIGDGPERKQLNEKVISLGLEKNILFLGKKNKKDIVSILLESDVFVLCSRSETFGVVFIEAMALGLPCIGTKCGGPEDIINELNGILVPKENVDAFADSIRYMVNNYKRYDSEIISKNCKKKYSPEVVASQVIEVFNNILENKK